MIFRESFDPSHSLPASKPVLSHDTELRDIINLYRNLQPV